jgi:leader peptidase (prepilin peptidase) / N-methyltransferase
MTVLLLATLAAAVAYDLRERRIPDAITLPAAVLALAAGAAADPARLAAGALAAALLSAAALARPDGMGLGDAKLAGVMGLALGPPVATALLVACAAGTAYGAALAVRRGVAAARVATVPFAPFLALGALWACLAPP